MCLITFPKDRSRVCTSDLRLVRLMAGAGSQQDWLVETEPETSVGIWELQKIQIRREYLGRQNINKKKRKG